MSNQIKAGEIEQFLHKAAKFGAASGVTVAVELEDGRASCRERVCYVV